MDAIFDFAVIGVLVALVVYVHRLTHHVRQLDKATRTLLRHLAPADRERHLVVVPSRKVEVVRVLREEPIADYKEAKAVIDALLAKRSK